MHHTRRGTTGTYMAVYKPHAGCSCPMYLIFISNGPIMHVNCVAVKQVKNGMAANAHRWACFLRKNSIFPAEYSHFMVQGPPGKDCTPPPSFHLPGTCQMPSWWVQGRVLTLWLCQFLWTSVPAENQTFIAHTTDYMTFFFALPV